MLNDMITYFQSNSSMYWLYVGQHIGLSLTALGAAFILAFSLAYWASRHQLSRQMIFFLAQGLRVIPSLAVLFIMIPFLGVGRTPALLALVFLALPPLIMNMTLGFMEVPAVLKETGLAMGMSSGQLFKRVTLPLALPHILTGIKLALVEIIASATLATYIGAGGLGSLIVTGLGLYRMDLLVIGGGSVAILSLFSLILMDYLVKVSEKS
ncbi:ABC transporter permease [Eremococcus coleocola]|uniref:ABC transporter, permease protein n=1 Tax=Eremococcus coleocola ACS-139-V-Col8 TaxID=908337 RepID=E4KPS2_9LACT|nr:ABC transporter permease [Eremococcus coleocola]EFR30939.1 ABC transporter, permease protein [Eremococcus coleocola ACS-139-V-Col8]